MKKQLLIIDTDAGGDDALAILLALSQKSSWRILAITCVFGNTTVDNVCNNVLKILKVSDETQIPVYRGCSNALVWESDIGIVYGDDGLGNVGKEFDHSGLKIQDEHASNILITLAKQYREEGVHLMALGPLTNIALAHRLDSEFLVHLKSLTVMGGNVEGIGNVTSAAEFNFFSDPESAHIVLSEAKCPTYMLPWETATNILIPWDLFEKMCQKKSKKGKFFKSISIIMEKKDKARGRKGFMDCDLLAVASLIQPECIKRKLMFPVSVETEGRFTRGQAVLKRKWDLDKNPQNVITIFTDFDEISLNKLRESILED